MWTFSLIPCTIIIKMKYFHKKNTFWCYLPFLYKVLLHLSITYLIGNKSVSLSVSQCLCLFVCLSLSFAPQIISMGKVVWVKQNSNRLEILSFNYKIKVSFCPCFLSFASVYLPFFVYLSICLAHFLSVCLSHFLSACLSVFCSANNLFEQSCLRKEK